MLRPPLSLPRSFRPRDAKLPLITGSNASSARAFVRERASGLAMLERLTGRLAAAGEALHVSALVCYPKRAKLVRVG